MRAARAHADGVEYETVSQAKGDLREGRHDPQWHRPVKELVDRARKQAEMFAQRRLSEERERTAERRLALRLIDIGYKVLSVELHPDKRGGSHEAMQRLNAVRSRLREAA
jgi:hypothetical protein